jgi:hypothetical protein
MITITVWNLLNKDLLFEEHYCIYIFRDNDTILYIGMSKHDIANRLLAHINRGSWPAKGPLWDLLYYNAPECYNWQIDLLTLDDCDNVVKEQFPDIITYDVERAERAMILHYCPCLNVENNPNGKRLPAYYKRPKQNFKNAPSDALGLNDCFAETLE